MPDEEDPKQATTQDAELAAESMAAGEEQAVVDVEDDYEAAQQFSVSDVDALEPVLKQPAATTSQFEVSEPEATRTEAQSTGNPDDYQQMASDIDTTPDESVTNVSDDLVKSFGYG